jgi:hypothetical protein
MPISAVAPSRMSIDLKRLIGKLNVTTKAALEAAAGLCLSRTHYQIETEHYLTKLLDPKYSDITLIFKYFEVDCTRLLMELNRTLDSMESGNTRTPAISPGLVKVVVDAWTIGSINFDAHFIRSGFVVLALLKDSRQMFPAIDKIDAGVLTRDFDKILMNSAEQGEGGDSEQAYIHETLFPSLTSRNMPRVFISYRRDDSEFYASQLYDRLRATGVRVFWDRDVLPPGTIFSEAIEQNVTRCDALVAIIGKKWLKTLDLRGEARLNSEQDWVRKEICIALQKVKIVIPCLVGGAKMPNAEALPEDLAGLIKRQWLHASKAHFRRDVEPLIQRIVAIKIDHPLASDA